MLGKQIRSAAEIGALWPVCKCGHLAQDHDDTMRCGAMETGQCPYCFTHGVRVPCRCTGYSGPTREEFKKLLTPEEIKHYFYD